MFHADLFWTKRDPVPSTPVLFSVVFINIQTTKELVKGCVISMSIENTGRITHRDDREA